MSDKSPKVSQEKQELVNKYGNLMAQAGEKQYRLNMLKNEAIRVESDVADLFAQIEVLIKDLNEADAKEAKE